ncbi:hypothetical protein LguiA_034725 [Lonicera macranthoides]
MTSFDDHLLWHPDFITNNTYITNDQDFIISYCKADFDDPFSEGQAGSINFSSILTGKCLDKIKASNSFHMEGYNSKKQNRVSGIQNPVSEAMEDITALFYDEERNEVYTGNRQGLVHVWLKCSITSGI